MLLELFILNQLNQEPNLVQHPPAAPPVVMVAQEPENQIERGMQNLEQYLLENPKDIEARFFLGSLYLKTGKPGRAVEHYEQVIRLAPFEETGYIAKSYACVQAKDTEGARKTIDRLFKIHPDSEFGHTMRGYSFSVEGKTEEAIKELEKAGTNGSLLLAMYYWEHGELEKAQKKLEAALEMKPKYSPIYYNIGILDDAHKGVYKRRATPEEAIKAVLVKIRFMRTHNLKEALVGFKELFQDEHPTLTPYELFKMYVAKNGLLIEMGISSNFNPSKKFDPAQLV